MSENTAFNNVAFTPVPVLTQKASMGATSTNHPILTLLSCPTVMVFWKLYDRYGTVVNERARQLSADNGSSTEAHRPISMYFCMDVKHLESAIDSVVIDDADSYYSLDYDTLRVLLEEKAMECKGIYDNAAAGRYSLPGT